LLPKGAKHLAWFNLNTQEGQEYWSAMNLAGDYASANHHYIHKRIAKSLGEKPGQNHNDLNHITTICLPGEEIREYT
jgi:RNA-splicing ligase RtcB